jgi:DNA-binding XRE family transcriptional regulator
MSNKARYKAFGEELVRLRKARGIATQKELSQLLGFTQQTVSRWEAGASRPRHPGWDIWDQEDISRKFRSLSSINSGTALKYQYVSETLTCPKYVDNASIRWCMSTPCSCH